MKMPLVVYPHAQIPNIPQLNLYRLDFTTKVPNPPFNSDPQQYFMVYLGYSIACGVIQTNKSG